MALTLFIIFIFSGYFIYKQKTHQAFYLQRLGYKERAINEYNAINNLLLLVDDNSLYHYAQELFYAKRINEAKLILQMQLKYPVSHDVYKLMGDINYEKKNYVDAETNYTIAVHMVPNRMLSREKLIDFYIARNDTSKTLYWANSIINMPVKVSSEITANIQNRARKILKKYSQ
jgi:exopolysaccharide biosynthesis predicted pyruvyltransferase EpsI